MTIEHFIAQTIDHWVLFFKLFSKVINKYQILQLNIHFIPNQGNIQFLIYPYFVGLSVFV